jgi:single-stranded-DNA-specific exonuclease
VDEVSFDIAPAAFADCARLEDELGVSGVVAQVLVRRGLADPGAARAFLAAGDRHDVSAFAGIDAAVDLILEHAGSGSRIIVHGDYDADGVCSAAILVRTLRSLDADVGWFLPDRRADGYGLNGATVERLAGEGVGLLITTDCGITAVDEVARARELGLDVVITDHHQPRSDGLLPDAPIVHPAVCGYPCVDLCAAGVAYKLAGALLDGVGEDPAGADLDLDLVALATVADCVPLLGENRRLVREGLTALASTRREGLRALLRITKSEPGSIDEQTIGFRLAPRINAAGRMQRADAGVELLLTDDPERASALAAELDALNADRRHVETRIVFEAEAQVAQQGERAAYVLAGEGWHPGVVGIVASRIVERTNRPVVMLALDGGQGTGSGRSIPGFDLLAGLDACAEHLLRHGGHRAAAGCTIAASEVDAFRAAFTAHAERVLRPEDLVRRERVDAVVGGDVLGLDLAEELRGLGPFGQSHPVPALLVPAARLTDPRPMGEGRHVRFTVVSGGVRASAVAFGRAKLPGDEGAAIDASFTLEVNRWNGAEEARLVLRSAAPAAGGPIAFAGRPQAFLDAALAEFDAWPRPEGVEPAAATASARDRRGNSPLATIAALVATGESVLVVAACEERRARQLDGLIGGFAITAWHQLERDPGLRATYDHVIALDPPASAGQRGLLTGSGDAWTTHWAWGDPELRFSLDVLEHDHAVDGGARALYAAVRAAPATSLDELLRGVGDNPRTATQAGRQLRVLTELGLLTLDRATGSLALLPAGATALERSATYRELQARLDEGRRWLSGTSAAAA